MFCPWKGRLEDCEGDYRSVLTGVVLTGSFLHTFPLSWERSGMGMLAPGHSQRFNGICL